MKTTKIFRFLLIGVVLFSCQAADHITYPEYYRSFRQVDRHLNLGEIENAVAKFDSLSDKIPHVPSSHLFRVARICADHNYCELAAKYLTQSLISGEEYGMGIRPHKTIHTCKEEIDEVLTMESEIHNKYFNFEYKARIDSMYEADQKARTELSYDDMNIIDSLNMILLLSQIKELGYPGEKIIGYRSAFNAFVMMLHMDRDKNNRIFKPILDKAFSEGQLWPRGYAWIVDRRRAWGDDELEPYYYHMPSQLYDSFTQEQKNEINRRRDSIGLAPK